ASRPDLTAALKDGRAGGGSGSLRHRLRDSLVGIEVALAVMLLGSAGLMGKSLVRILSTDPGFRTEGLVGVELSLPDRRITGGAPMVALQALVTEAGPAGTGGAGGVGG